MSEDEQRPLRNGRHSSDEWLLGLIRDSVLAILDEREKRYQERFESQKDAIMKVNEATEKRFENVNEFRKALTDRDVLYMPRAESNARYNAVVEKLETHDGQDEIKHKELHNRIDEIGRRVDNFEGSVKGSRATLVAIAGSATFLVAVIVLGTFFFNAKATPAPQPQVIYVPAPAGSMLPTTPPQPAPR